jgi:hypothetical protein
MKSSLLIFTVFLSLHLRSQQVDWARTLPQSNEVVCIVADGSGNAWVAATYFQPMRYFNQSFINSDTAGTYLNVYSPTGNLLNSFHYPNAFWIEQMLFDGNQHFYFAGAFNSVHNFSAGAINSRGNADGMVGKMDMNGNIVWIKSFGGGKTDFAHSLTFNSQLNRLVVCGSIADSLYVNNSFTGAGTERAMFIGEYDLNGNLVNHNTIDFLPTRNFSNFGYEIRTESNGNYMLLLNREGKWWSNDTINAPDEGYYMFKLDQQLNTIWTSFLINGSCYYGYGCGRTAVNNSGGCFVTRYCSSKYGGTGELVMLDGNTGTVSWSESHNDGAFADAFSDGTNLYTVGTEGANPCPCQYNHVGYPVVKKYNAQNQVVGLTQLSPDIVLTRIIKSAQGRIYVTGFFVNNFTVKSVVIGKDTLFSNSWGHRTFIMSMKDINCQPVLLNNQTIHPFTYQLCPGTSLTLEATPGSSAYQWNNGATTSSISVSQPGEYYVQVRQLTGCEAYSLRIKVDVTQPVTPEISYVTYYQSTDGYYIHFKGDHFLHKYFKVYRDAGNGMKPAAIISGPYSWTDDGALSINTQPKYYMSSTDTCGTSSSLSSFHAPLRLRFTDGSVKSLIWDKYIGFPYQKFYILKGGLQKRNVIDSVSTSVTMFTDKAKYNGEYYQVMIKKNDGTMVYSNILKYSATTGSAGVTGIESTANDHDIAVFPNPSAGEVFIRLKNTNANKNVKVELWNASGQLLSDKSYAVSDGENVIGFERPVGGEGVYFLRIFINENVYIKSFIVKE